MRFDVVDAIIMPKAAAQATGTKTAPESTGSTQPAKPAK
jgi:hypothetical protein